MDRVPSTLTAAFSICMVSPLVLNTQWNLRPELGLLTTYVIIVKLRSRPKVEYQGLLQGVFSCKDAAQQVLMSVCLSVRVPS